MSGAATIESFPGHLMLYELYGIKTESIKLEDNRYTYKENIPIHEQFVREEILEDAIIRSTLSAHEIACYLIKYQRLRRWRLFYPMITLFVELRNYFVYFRGNLYIKV